MSRRHAAEKREVLPDAKYGDRVVSTATLLDETLWVRHPAGLVELPAGQVELVATDRAYEGRGLVRALMGWAHERSRARGHLVQVMIGIPYFFVNVEMISP